ncbi:hypothetical protein ACWCXB_33735 [Streptomyces sp. NPDC001514]
MLLRTMRTAPMAPCDDSTPVARTHADLPAQAAAGAVGSGEGCLLRVTIT